MEWAEWLQTCQEEDTSAHCPTDSEEGGEGGLQKRNANKEKHLIPPDKYGGGALMLSASGPGARFEINGTTNSTKYQESLAENLFVSARKLRFGHP